MRRITKGNAREHLLDSIGRFQKMTGESIAVVYSWKGSLSAAGNDQFRKHVSESKENFWRLLTLEHSKPDEFDFSNKEFEMMELVKQDLKSHNVNTLRKILSWATQKTTSKFPIIYLISLGDYLTRICCFLYTYLSIKHITILSTVEFAH